MDHHRHHDQQQQHQHHWGYSQTEGITPDQWAKYYKIGERQSPINILVPDLEQLRRDTCCGKTPMSDHNDAHLAHQLVNQLALGTTTNSKHSTHHQRLHLDSQSHERASSTSSSGSALSSSPYNSSATPSPTKERSRHVRSVASRSSRNQHQPAGGQLPASDSQSQQDHEYDSGEYDDDDDEVNGNYGDHNEELDGANLRKPEQNTRFCVSNKKIFLGYPRYLSSVHLSNTGHSWQVDIPQELANHTLLSGPPFGEREYKLAQLHSHWAEDCSRGSEHQVNGQSFAAEIHFVHWNCTDFASMQEASKHRHGLAVLGVLVQALEGDEHRNRHLDKIIQSLRQVQKPNSKIQVDARLDLKKLFPVNRWVYASYEGSLTTPPLSEVVDWVVFLNPIQCSESQIEQFRQLGCTGDGRQSLVKNCRPVQPHNKRLVSIWTHH